MRPTRSTTISRSAPASATPRLEALFATDKNVNRTNAVANEPTVRIKRTFLGKRFAKLSLRNFMPHLLRERFAEKNLCPRPASLSQDGAWCGRERRRRGRA